MLYDNIILMICQNYILKMLQLCEQYDTKPKVVARILTTNFVVFFCNIYQSRWKLLSFYRTKDEFSLIFQILNMII